VREVATNLLLNAAEAMEGHGLVELVAENGPEGWRLLVRDQGTGIPHERRALLFEPGFTTKADGSGMGLYVCRRMMESRGGRLSLLPGSGPGATFEAVFPNPSVVPARG
jgi:signal transduction histidine kinase